MTTVTASLNASLLPVAVGCGVVLLSVLLYRVTNILVGLLLNAMLAVTAVGNPAQRLSQLGLIGNAAQFAATVFLALLRLGEAAFRALWMVVWAMLPFLVLASVLAVMEVRWYETMAVLTDGFNHGPLSSLLRTVVLTPLQVLDAVGSAVLPIYNFGVFVFVQAPLTLLMWLLRGEGLAHFAAAFGEARLAAGRGMGAQIGSRLADVFLDIGITSTKTSARPNFYQNWSISSEHSKSL